MWTENRIHVIVKTEHYCVALLLSTKIPDISFKLIGVLSIYEYIKKCEYFFSESFLV